MKRLDLTNTQVFKLVVFLVLVLFVGHVLSLAPGLVLSIVLGVARTTRVNS